MPIELRRHVKVQQRQMVRVATNLENVTARVKLLDFLHGRLQSHREQETGGKGKPPRLALPTSRGGINHDPSRAEKYRFVCPPMPGSYSDSITTGHANPAEVLIACSPTSTIRPFGMYSRMI